MNIVEHRFEKLRLGQQHSLSATNCSDCVQCLHPATPMLQHESHTVAYNKLARTATLSEFAIRTLEFQMTIHYVPTMKHEHVGVTPKWSLLSTCIMASSNPSCNPTLHAISI